MTMSEDASRNEMSPPRAALAQGPEGLGGLLMLPIIGTSWTIGVTAVHFALAVRNWAGLKAIALGVNEKAAALRLPVGLSLFCSLVFMGMGSLCLYRIFTRAPSVPKLMTIFYAMMIAGAAIEVWADSAIAATFGHPMDSDVGTNLMRSIVASAIWIPYFHRSKRVANTFRARENQIDKEIPNIFS